MTDCKRKQTPEERAAELEQNRLAQLEQVRSARQWRAELMRKQNAFQALYYVDLPTLLTGETLP